MFNELPQGGRDLVAAREGQQLPVRARDGLPIAHRNKLIIYQSAGGPIVHSLLMFLVFSETTHTQCHVAGRSRMACDSLLKHE